jgi:hypothetical protein
VILTGVGHVHFRKSLIFVAILRGQLGKCAISGLFCHLRPLDRGDFSGKPAVSGGRRAAPRRPEWARAATLTCLLDLRS